MKDNFINNTTYNYKYMFILVYQEGPILAEYPHEPNIRVCFSNLFEI